MREYDPRDWYWSTDDGRVFGSKALAVLAKDDAGYAAFVEAGNAATVWPRDDKGAQTDAALDAVLSGHGLSTAGPVRLASGYDLLKALTDDERAASLTSAVKTWDRLMIQARPTPFPETNEKVARFAKGVGTTPKSLFDRALGAGA